MNDLVCLCQGLMRRVMPWIGCSSVHHGFLWFKVGWRCDVWRGTPLAGRTLLSSVSQDSAVHVSTLGFASPPPNHTCVHCITIIRPPLLLCTCLYCFTPFSPKPTHTHQFFFLLQEHIFKLMKSDSYARFLRSNIYQDLLLARKKVSCTLWPLFFFFYKSLSLLLHFSYWFDSSGKRHSSFISNVVCSQ